MLRVIKPEPTEPVSHAEMCTAMSGLICRIDGAAALAGLMHREFSGVDEETLDRARYALETYLEDTIEAAGKIREMMNQQPLG